MSIWEFLIFVAVAIVVALLLKFYGKKYKQKRLKKQEEYQKFIRWFKEIEARDNDEWIESLKEENVVISYYIKEVETNKYVVLEKFEGDNGVLYEFKVSNISSDKEYICKELEHIIRDRNKGMVSRKIGT